MPEEPEEPMTHWDLVERVDRLMQKAIERLEGLFEELPEEGELDKEQLAVIKTIFHVAEYMRR